MRPYGYGSGRYRPNLRFGPPGPVPPVIARLVAACVAVFLLQSATGGWLTRQFGLVPALVQRGEVWRLFTYQFLHGGVFHLLWNMFVLWMVGSELAVRWGSRFFLRYYFVCAVGGGILFTLASLNTWIPCVGASGAIYGMLIAYAMWFPNREVYVFFAGPIRVRYLVAFLIILELLQPVEGTGTGIAHTAHLGGTLFGYAYLRWNGVAGFDTLDRATWRRLRKRFELWRLRRRMRGRGWDDRTIH